MGKKYLLLLVAFFTSICVVAQVRVTGTVLSADDDEPIIGATVMLKGKSNVAVATDLDGKFALTVPSSKSVIEVKYVGMKTVELKATEKNVTVKLVSDAQQLGDVVVTGMGTVDKRLFTGATAKINAEDAMISGVADISRSLEGRAAGVQVQNVSGTFGTAPKIRVRGATSIYGDSKPLWVVDGVILEDAVELDADALSSGDATTLIASAVAGLNADDIESFQVLKDGSATSIYGARAMAGVIVVTTKQGRAGHTSINYTGELTMRFKPSYNDFNISNSQEQMGIYKEMEQKGWLSLASLVNSSTSGVYGTMYKLLNSYNPVTGEYGIANTEAAKNAYLREAEFRNTDWFDELFKTNIMQTHSVSISGGTDRGTFYTSFSYMNDPGWYIDSQVDRYTFNANATYKLSNSLSLKLLTSDSYRKQKAPGTLSQDIDAVNGEVKRSFDINPYSYSLNTSRTTDPRAVQTRNYCDFNIFDELENNYIDIGVTDVKFQGDLTWNPFRGMKVTATGSFRHNTAQQNHYVKDNSNMANAYRAGVDPENAAIRGSNRYLYTDPDDPNSLPVSVLPKGGIYFHDLRTMSQFDLRIVANYNRTFGVHNVSALGGFEAQKLTRMYEKFEGWGICYDNGNLPFTDWKLFKQMNEENGAYYSLSEYRNRSTAYIGTASYGYDMRYIVNGTIRYEGTNRLGKSRSSRWLPTWNVSGAWNADAESWFQNPVLATAKLRLSYSLTADSGPGSISNAMAIYRPSRPWRQDTEAYEQALTLSELANSELTYEKKHEFDIGADLGFLNNRLNVVVDWYKRNNFDLIGLVYTSGVGGTLRKWANTATMKSHGVEFTISSRNIQSPNFNWSTDFTFAYSKNTITNLKGRSTVMNLIQGSGYAIEGYPVRALFSIPFVGLNENGIPQIINQDGEVTTSNIDFQEFDKIDFLKYEGPVDPTMQGGLGNTINWKGFHFNLFLTYAFGNKLRLTPAFASGYSDLSSMPKEFKNRWVVPGDEKYTDVPAIASYTQAFNDKYLGRAYNAYNYSTARVADGGFIRLKEVSVTYDLPASVLRALRISSASVKLQGTNLLLLYSDKKLNGQDPEFFNSGGVASPIPRQMTFTLRFGL